MKKVLLTVFAAAAVTTANAQVTDGYYRVENDDIQQCIYFKSKTPQDIDYAKGEYPLIISVVALIRKDSSRSIPQY